MDNYTTLEIGNCINFNHVVKQFCLPFKSACNNTVIDGLFTNQHFNCAKPCKTDPDAFIMVPFDGTLMFQTNIKLPTDAEWGTDITLELYDLNNELIEGNHTDFASRWVVGSDGRVGYQTIEIDFANVPTQCGYFKIISGEIEIFTEMFKKDDCTCFVEIESIVKEFDCWNNYYGLSKGGFTGTDFHYSNKIYLEATEKYFGANIRENSLTELVRVIPKSLIAPYMAKYLSFKILKEKNVLVNGYLWKTKDITLTPREKSSMFWVILEFERKQCEDSGTC